MKIVFVSHFYHPHIGGVEKHVAKVAAHLIGKGHTVTVFTKKFTHELPQTETFEKIKIVRFSYPEIKFLGLVFIWLEFLKNIKIFHKADVVHVHDVFIWYLPVKLLLFWKPIYITFHGWEGKYPIPEKFKAIRRLAAFLTDGNICVGEYIEKWYRIRANYTIYGAAENTKKAVNKNSKRIVYLGRLEKDTGLPEYLKALAGIPPKDIFFVGDGPLREQAERVGEVTGFVKNPENYIRSAKVVLTSGYLGIMEALQFGKIVVSTYANPLKKDYLEKSPLKNFIVIKERGELENALKDVLGKSKTYQEKARKGQIWAKKQTWEKVTQTYLRLWRSKK